MKGARTSADVAPQIPDLVRSEEVHEPRGRQDGIARRFRPDPRGWEARFVDVERPHPFETPAAGMQADVCQHAGRVASLCHEGREVVCLVVEAVQLDGEFRDVAGPALDHGA